MTPGPIAPLRVDGAPAIPIELAGGSRDPKSVAARFEAVMASILLSEMRRGSSLQLFGESAGAQVFEGIFDQMLGESLAARGGLGLARSVEDSIRRMTA
jgi:Rod binding domain-containing protein